MLEHRKMDRLVEISLDDLKDLCGRYKKYFPRKEVGYYVLKNYINWLELEPSLQGFKAYCLNGEWSDGTFVLKHYSFIYGDTLDESNTQRLTEALCLLNIDPAKHYRYVYSEAIRSGVWDFVKRKGLKTDHEWKFLYYKMSPEDSLKLKLPDLPKEFSARPISLDDTAEVNANWPFKYPTAEGRVKNLLKFNDSIGLYTDDGKLAAWIIRYEFSASGILHVHEPYRRKGLAKYLVTAIAKKIGQRGDYSYATILKDNVLSNHLYQSVGYVANTVCYYLEIVPSVTTQVN